MTAKQHPHELLSLLQSLNHTSSDTRCEALETLIELGKPFSLIAARALCQDPNVTVRNTAVEALGAYGSRRQDLRRLTTAIHDPSWVVRSTAAEGLGHFGGNAALKLLLSALKDSHPVVRRDAATALGAFGKDAISALDDAARRERNDQAMTGIRYGLFLAGRRSELRIYLSLLGSDDFLARNNVINGINPEDLASEEAGMVKTAVTAYLKQENVPVNTGDALALLNKLRNRTLSPSAG